MSLEKIRTRTGIRTSDFRISSSALYHLSYPGSHASSCSNRPLETDAILARQCGHDTICHLLTTSGHEYDIQIKLLIEDKLIICALGNLHYQVYIYIRWWSEKYST